MLLRITNRSVSTILAILVAFIVGWYGHKSYSYKFGDSYVAHTNYVRENSPRYAFTSPLLFIDNSNAVFSELDSLKETIDKARAQAIHNGEAEQISVYFRDLNNTRWTGIDEDQLYDPASLKKVVLLVAYLRAAEDNPALASREVYYHGDSDQGEFYKSTHTLKKGQTYPISDLVIDMIVKSGNDSANSLFEDFDPNQLAQVYTDLGLPFPKSKGVEEISPKMYSRLFRVLYSSTYLQRDLSEQVLSLLSQTEFDKGLTALLPKGLVVAHKFGERINPPVEGETQLQLHDCGIVYYPGHPYFLCVMTKGTDFLKLQSVIAQISFQTYQYWDKEFK